MEKIKQMQEFLNSLSQQQMQEGVESMVVSRQEASIGGTSYNGKNCTNGKCAKSSNAQKCTNTHDSCEGARNIGKCKEV